MAGQKGRSGGARENSGGARENSGGARPGAGRPKKGPAVNSLTDPLEFLRAVWTGELEANPAQVKAATAALGFVHARKGASTKKEADASKTPSGRYAARQGPRLSH